MLFSVITPSLNCSEFIARNIASVQQQNLGPDQLEHWVIDGGSKDGTLAILEQNKHVQWISEPDKGLSDAVNKGIQRAKGDWIIWLNADDFLAPNACCIFLEYVRQFPAIKVFAGDQTWLGYDGTLEETVKGWDYNLNELLNLRTSINQASTFVHREVYATVGLLDISNRYAMDYEWMVRAMHHYQCIPIPEVLTYYQRRKGSITDRHLVRQFEDFLRIRRLYKKPLFSKADLFFRFYIYTDRLRRIEWLRKRVQRIRRFCGKKYPHPI